ncbi:alpha-ketoglutarate decarboxylase [Tamlana sp. 2_MG-2023]|uniref:alpha-ketoglutarate decarboxylase n=1 Tax=unclassified Tamlana TaxID=2614803 RepID=UPI0026E2F060|nr:MULTISPECIES: alpha-ketoglutarate decarboxylase [unclassified Tamlana]MDO6759887.1 alpha-ketoglutarate decarboxylase [Tamlana sp. 2_MG-2023]MDO6791943.1 alpha-ketoglutarate decarboxylase [Tamlana sp. 1_MG-2023]
MILNKALFRISKKTTFLCVVFSCCFINIQAQQSKSDFWNHVRFGGNLGLSFGNEFFSGTVAPSAIYQFDEHFALGLGLNATFNSQKDFYKSTILGGSLIGLYNIIPQIQVSAEFEQLNVDRNYESRYNFPDDNYWLSALYLGAGYRTGNITFGIRYDVLYDDYDSIYGNPWSPFFRVYF